MNLTLSAGLCTLLFAGAGLIGGHAQTPTPTSAVHDGQRDFDFNIGVWHTHIKRILDPFASSSESVELNGSVQRGHMGTVVYRQLDEIQAVSIARHR